MKKILALGLGLWLAGNTASAGTLSLQEYLKEVESQGPDYQSAQAAVVGLEKQSHQQDLTYSPVLVASYNHVNDTELPNGFNYPNMQTDTAGVSVTDKLPFGPTVSLGYAFTNYNATVNSQLNQIVINGVSLASVFPTSEYQIAPVVSLSVPLFKDFGGAQTSAGVHKVQYQLESAQKSSAFQREQLLYNAKLAYWSVSLARAQVKIRKTTLERSQKIWEWTKKRVKRNLAESPDALQAEASVRLAELDLQVATEAARSARLQFNRYRNLKDGSIAEDLDELEDSLANTHVHIPKTLPDRLDLKAVEDTARQQKAAYDEAYQNVYPDITVNGSWRGNGLDPNYATANSTAWSGNYPTWSVGAQFTLPLDVFTSSTVADGYKKNYESSVMSFQDKQLEVNQEWTDLENRLQDVDRRLAMATEIESIQQKKADQEKKRLEYGRTTEFQLLSFENDYNAAQLNKLAIISEKLSVLAQAEWWLSTDLHPTQADASGDN
ncbi:MAG TPA: TolC family protein [bacterium]|nr:TolC family protein [bacterium]